jgi:hypothetical protein
LVEVPSVYSACAGNPVSAVKSFHTVESLASVVAPPEESYQVSEPLSPLNVDAGNTAGSNRLASGAGAGDPPQAATSTPDNPMAANCAALRNDAFDMTASFGPTGSFNPIELYLF